MSVPSGVASAAVPASVVKPRPVGPGSLVRGMLAALLLVANTLFWCSLLFPLALFKLAFRRSAALDAALNRVATGWVSGNALWMRCTQRTRWDVQGVFRLQPQAWYLVSCNHQSWVDVLVLQRVLNRRIPLLKFFLKRELLFVPVMGLAWWALGFPFMRRHSRSALRRRPELHGQDQAAARRACAGFSRVPTSVMNFVEGTRFTPDKQRLQASPYRHLLKPRAGALASTLAAMGPRFDSMLDLTIVYPHGAPSFWMFLGGRVPEIVVRCRVRPLPPELLAGNYIEDPAFRASFARWLSALWAEKDQEIDTLLGRSPR